VKELSGSVSLFLATDKAPMNKSFECRITSWKIKPIEIPDVTLVRAGDSRLRWNKEEISKFSPDA
jgi:hypothetical protein